MSVVYNNGPIISSGLVLCYDAGNKRSYPGSGTTIYDISGNGRTGTLNGGVTYSSGNLSFDGSSGYVSFSNPLNQSNLVQVWTVSGWINITDKISQTLLGGLNQGCDVCYVQGNNSLLYLNNGINDYYIYGGDLGGIGWTYVTFRFNNATGARTIYKNLADVSTGGPNNTSTPAGQASTFYVGYGGSGWLQGQVGHLAIYNRYISDTEVTQNFNATRGRYGI
jgi:hypothetical protein